jgi:hypothetical protein
MRMEMRMTLKVDGDENDLEKVDGDENDLEKVDGDEDDLEKVEFDASISFFLYTIGS